MAWTTQPHMEVSSVGGIQGCSLLLFCCRTSAVAGDWWKGRSRMLPASLLLTQSGGYRKNGAGASANARVRQRKEDGRVSGTSPEFDDVKSGYRSPGPRLQPGQNPRTRRRERSGRSPECRRPSLFLLHHQKAHSLFPLQEKENGGFEACGLRRTPPRPGRGASPPSPRRGDLYQASFPFSSGSTSSSDRMAHSIMLSSGSKVVKFCIHSPGAVRKWARALSLRPTQRLNS